MCFIMWLWNLGDNRKEKHPVLSIVLVYFGLYLVYPFHNIRNT